MIFIQKGVGGVYKSPPQPGADCEGRRHTVHTLFYYISKFKINEVLNMLGTAAEDEEYQEATAPSYCTYRLDLKRVNISVKAMVGR